MIFIQNYCFQFIFIQISTDSKYISYSFAFCPQIEYNLYLDTEEEIQAQMVQNAIILLHGFDIKSNARLELRKKGERITLKPTEMISQGEHIIITRKPGSQDLKRLKELLDIYKRAGDTNEQNQQAMEAAQKQLRDDYNIDKDRLEKIFQENGEKIDLKDILDTFQLKYEIDEQEMRRSDNLQNIYTTLNTEQDRRKESIRAQREIKKLQQIQNKQRIQGQINNEQEDNVEEDNKKLTIGQQIQKQDGYYGKWILQSRLQ